MAKLQTHRRDGEGGVSLGCSVFLEEVECCYGLGDYVFTAWGLSLELESFESVHFHQR